MMDLIWIAPVALLAVLIGLWWWQRRKALEGIAAARGLEALDTISAWEPTPTRVMTVQERLAYGVLTRALPEYVVLAQVPLSRFIKVPTRNSYAEWLSRVGQLCADFVVCDGTSQVIAVIDVRLPVGRASERNQKRHERIQKVLRTAGIPLHIWYENSLPSSEVARDSILPTNDIPPLPGALPRADEPSGLREPPSSTWFDDLDSIGPGPFAPTLTPRARRPGDPEGSAAAEDPRFANPAAQPPR